MNSVLALLCPQVNIKELPNVDYCRKCRGIVRIISEASAAYEVAMQMIWLQIFHDETSRKAVPLTAFAVAVKNDDALRSIVLSCSEIGLGGSASDTVSNILRILDNGREHLVKWAERFTLLHPNEDHNIPPPENLTIAKCRSAADTTDTCNQAYKSRALLREEIKHSVALVNAQSNEDNSNPESSICDEPGK